MSNIQAQIDALAVSIQVLDNTLSNVTGNTLSNYNQLSRIVAQQGNIYNSVYFGTGNITTSNLFVNSNANIIGNLGVSGNIIGQSNIILPSGSKMVIGGTSINDRYDLSISGNLNVATSMRSGTMGQFGNITYHIASDGTPLYSTVGTGRNLILNHSTFSGAIGPNFPNPECMTLMTNVGSSNIFQWGMYSGIVKDVAISNPTNSLRMDFGSTNSLSTNLNSSGGNTITPQMTLRYTGNLGTLGINRTNPLYALDVNGTANISGNIIMNTNANVIGNLGVTGNLIGTSNLILLNGRIGLGMTNPQQTLDVTGSANISVDAFIRNNMAIGSTSANANLDVVGNARISGNLMIGANYGIKQPGILLEITNDAIYDTDVNGSVSGNVLNQFSFGNRKWVFALDSADSGRVYFGSQGQDTTDPDFDYYFKRKVGLQIQPALTGNTTDFNSALSVLGNAVITGNLNVDSGTFWIDATNNRVGINNTNPRQALDIVGSANITGNISIGSSSYTRTNGTALIISQNETFDNTVNGTISGNTYPQLSFGAGREHIFSVDAVDANISYFGISGGGAPDSDFFITYKRATGMKISDGTYDTSDFTEALKVVGVANISGNTLIRNNLLIGSSTTTPNANLDIIGNARISGNLTVNSGTFWVDATKNRVGILNTNPQQAIDIKGSANISVDTFVRNNMAIGATSASANLDVVGNARISGNLNVDSGTFWVDATNNRVGILNTNPQYALDVKGDANIVGTFISSNITPNYDSGWFAVALNTPYPLNLGFTIDLARPPTFKVLFSTTSTGIIGDGTGTANVVCDITSQGINSNFNQSYSVRYSSTSSIIIHTGVGNAALYFNGNTQVSPTSGYYRVFAY